MKDKEAIITFNLSIEFFQIYQIYDSKPFRFWCRHMALFGKTAKQWRDENPNKKGNVRDDANASKLICLANLENLNAVFINEGLSQSERLTKLNQIAISQMSILLKSHTQLLNPKIEEGED